MTAIGPEQRSVRLFLDAGVIIQGCWTMWGAAKAVLILATLRDYYTVVLAQSIEHEIVRAEARRLALLSKPVADDFANSITGWIERVRIERYPIPGPREIDLHSWNLLPVVRHSNDLPSIVTAIQAKPDWVISTNEDHWNEALAQRTGLRIATPRIFLEQLAQAFANR